MNSFKKTLEQFDETLRKYNPINYTALKSPLPKKEVESYMYDWGIRDSNLTELLSWKNGFDFRGSIQNRIFEWGAFLSVERINEYVTQNINEDDPEINAEGNKVFVRLTENGSGDTLLFNLKKSEFGQIHLFSVPLLIIDEPISYYDSILAMIKTETEAYEQGAYRVDEESGKLQVIRQLFFPLAKRLNPKSNFWKEE